jgi:hypothetical protein
MKRHMSADQSVLSWAVITHTDQDHMRLITAVAEFVGLAD